MPIPYRKMFVMFPPRPDGSSRPEDIISYPGWWAQRKFNGTRTLVFLDPNGTIHFRNRHQEPHRAYTVSQAMEDSWQDLRNRSGLQTSKWSVFDGELLHSKTPNVKNRLVLFDLLVQDGSYLTKSTYRDRYERLNALLGSPTKSEGETGRKLALRYNECLWLAENHTWTDARSAMALFKDKTDLDEIEGLVLKDPGGTLSPGVSETNNSSWLVRVRKPHKNYRY